MARTNSQKRAQTLEAGRQRQARRRARMSEAGKPLTTKLDCALAEALAFQLATAVLAGAQTDAPLSIHELTETTLTILVDREGYDRLQCKRAIARRLGLRKEHLEPSYIPSLHADPAAQKTRAEATCLS